MLAKISTEEFEERLAELSLRGRSWPRNPRDRHILLKSMTLLLQTERDYTEQEVNARLMEWVEQLGQIIYLDHVTLRRYLVSAGYLSRDLAGRRYQVDEVKTREMFEDAVELINPVAVVEEALRRSEEEKRAYLAEH